MAASNNITIKFKASGANALKNAIKALADEQDRLNDKFKGYVKGQDQATKKGRLLNNALATMRSKMLLASFAMTLLIKPLMKFAKEAAKVESMATAFNTLAGATENSSVALDHLKSATNNTMSEFDLFQQANNAMILGVSKNSNEMAEMFDIAQRLGRALGRDTKSSVESLITGIGRQSRLMLDNIGIIVKADEAYEKYAKRLGTTADKLSDADKKTAFLEATMESARAKVASLGGEVHSSQDSFDAFSATVSDLSVALGDSLKGAFTGAMDAFVKFVDVNKDGSAEVALGSMNLDIMITHLNRYKNELDRINAKLQLNTDLQKGSITSEEYQTLIDQAAEASHHIANLEVHVFELQRALMMPLPKAPIFELFPSFDKSFNPIVEMEGFNQEAETLLNDFYIKRHEQGLEFGALEQARLEEAARTTIENENELKQVLLDIEAHFAEARKKIKDKEVEQLSTIQDVYSETYTAIADIVNANQERIISGQKEAARNEISELKKTRAYKKADAATQKAMEDKIKDDRNKEIKKAFRLQQLAQVGQVWMNIATGISKGYAGGLLAGMAQQPFLMAVGGIQSAAILAQQPPTMEQGGLIGGRRHSAGGTIIEAEQGEFVMSRNAVNAVGVEAMNRINQGGGAGAVNISFSGNVMSQDFIEDEAIPMIKEAIRRGADIGVS
jgi:hypothetical protein